MLTDTHRIARIACALGPDALVLHRMRGREELGRLAQWDLELLAERSDLFAPRCSEEGEIIAALLAAADGTRTFGQLATLLRTRFPERFPTEQSAHDYAARLDDLWAR